MGLPVVPDRVKETTTTVGTGTLTLAGAATGFRSFSAVGDGQDTYYCVAHQTADEWEVGLGRYTSSGTTLRRDRVLASSNAGAKVSFSAGTKDVFVVYPAQEVYQADATVYVSGSTGSDATGDGSSGAPFATVGKALSVIPSQLRASWTVSVADGTYAEALDIQRFAGAGGSLKVAGNTTTTNNVSFTGTVSHTARDTATTCCCVVGGPVNVELEGLRLNASAGIGIRVTANARVVFDRCNIGSATSGTDVIHGGYLEFQQDCTISGWTTRGVGAFFGGRVSYAGVSNGTLTVTGPGTAGNGVHLGYGSQFIISSGAATLNITITGVQYGFQLGLSSLFQHNGSAGTVTVDNASKPASSAGVLATDCSSWSTPRAVVVDNVTNAFEANSISYVEATGTRTITNVTATSAATQNSVIFLP